MEKDYGIALKLSVRRHLGIYDTMRCRFHGLFCLKQFGNAVTS